MRISVDLPKVVGKGYSEFWKSKHRYLVVKGSRGSKKSTTAALKIVYNMMKYPLANTLVVRRWDVLNRQSTFQQLLWAVQRLHVQHLWDWSYSPLSLTYRPSGNRIIFRGLDDVHSITSITFAKGVLAFVWLEEAYQVESEETFNKLDLSIRGVLPAGTDMFKQVIITFNPWNAGHWLKARFFDEPDSDTLALTTTYLCNEWLGSDDIALFENMRKRNPRRYAVEGLGEWGRTTGLVYDNWTVQGFDRDQMLRESDGRGGNRYRLVCGLDFGFSVDPTAFVAVLVDDQARVLYVVDEIYEKRLTNADIVRRVQSLGYGDYPVVADCADPRTINELNMLGLSRVRPSRKGADSIRAGISILQDWDIVVHPRCVNTVKEFSNYTWDTDRFGNTTGKPVDKYNHAMDALRYATQTLTKARFSFE